MDKFVLDILEKKFADLNLTILSKVEKIVKNEKENEKRAEEISNIMFEMKNISDYLKESKVNISGRFFGSVDLDALMDLKRRGW